MSDDVVALSAVPVAGGALTVASWGPPDAPAVIALHGLTGTHLAWAAHARRAGTRFRLIAPDLRGRGASSAVAGPWGFGAHVADVVAVLDAFEIDRTVLIGHSMGAYIALAVAAGHPERVRGLVLVDGGLPEGAQNAGLYAEISRRALEGLEALHATVFASPEEYLASRRPLTPAGVEWDDDLERQHLAVLVEEGGGYRVRGSLDAVRADTDYIHSVAPGAPLRALSRPAYLLSATDGFVPDSRGTYWDEELAEWEALLPNLRTERFSGVNHASIMVRDEPVTAALDAIERLL